MRSMVEGGRLPTPIVGASLDPPHRFAVPLPVPGRN